MKKRIRSAVPIYGMAALWLLLGVICPCMLLKVWFLILIILASTAVYFVLSKLFPGREVEVEMRPDSGDKNVDELISRGRARLKQLICANEEISDAQISAQLDRMVSAAEDIFGILEKDTTQAQAVRRFMNYYLPTAEKLMNNYRLMLQNEAPGENIRQATRSIESSLDMIAAAFEKQADNLFKDRVLDIETDIDVLETMMAGDGLIDKGSINDESRMAKIEN